MIKIKCDLCNKKVFEDEITFIHDRFRGKDSMYCRECLDDYENANASFQTKDDLDQFIGFIKNLHR